MKRQVSAADANRGFSSLLRAVREDRASYVVTSHGKPVARIVPYETADEKASDGAREALLKRLASQPALDLPRWSRDELYERD